jgi:hypothetical protein
MIDSVHRADVQIDHVHNAALCKEIGERLVVDLGEMPIVMSPRLMLLMSRLRDEPLIPTNSIG